MKYLREIAVLALVVIAATSVYKIVHKHYHHKHHEVEIQATDDGGNAGLIGNGDSLKTNHNHHQVKIQHAAGLRNGPGPFGSYNHKN